jgi:hypothetical protein
MHQLTDYVLAIRAAGAPPAPEGVKTVDLAPAEGEDMISSTINGLRASGLKAADFRSLAIFLAPDGPAAIVPYAALCGFAGRRIDVYADGAVLEFGRLDQGGGMFKDAGRPPQHLMWAQVGGPAADGIPTVHIGSGSQEGLVSPQAASVIRYAARLRMVPSGSSRDALAAFVLVAAVRRRAEDRFPFLSTGTEPTPVTKDDKNQGVDLELIRREAAQYRQDLRAERVSAEIVPPVPVSPRNQRIAKANAFSIREVLQRLGSSCDDRGLWHCPRPRNHSNGDRNPSMKVSGDNRTRCPRCDAEKVGSTRLVVDVLGLTPDEAVSFILDSNRVVARHMA